MITELIKELNELEEYKHEYEYAQKDKQTMSDLLYDYMIKEYEATSYGERCDKYIKNICKDCIGRDGCQLQHTLPEDIGIPIKSDKAWIPATKSCGEFEWD